MLIVNAKKTREGREFQLQGYYLRTKIYFKFSCYTIDWIIFIPILNNRETIYVQLNKKEFIGFSVDILVKVLYIQKNYTLKLTATTIVKN